MLAKFRDYSNDVSKLIKTRITCNDYDEGDFKVVELGKNEFRISFNEMVTLYINNMETVADSIDVTDEFMFIFRDSDEILEPVLKVYCPNNYINIEKNNDHYFTITINEVSNIMQNFNPEQKFPIYSIELHNVNKDTVGYDISAYLHPTALNKVKIISEDGFKNHNIALSTAQIVLDRFMNSIVNDIGYAKYIINPTGIVWVILEHCDLGIKVIDFEDIESLNTNEDKSTFFKYGRLLYTSNLSYLDDSTLIYDQRYSRFINSDSDHDELLEIANKYNELDLEIKMEDIRSCYGTIGAEYGDDNIKAVVSDIQKYCKDIADYIEFYKNTFWLDMKDVNCITNIKEFAIIGIVEQDYMGVSEEEILVQLFTKDSFININNTYNIGMAYLNYYKDFIEYEMGVDIGHSEDKTGYDTTVKDSSDKLITGNPAFTEGVRASSIENMDETGEYSDEE